MSHPRHPCQESCRPTGPPWHSEDHLPQGATFWATEMRKKIWIRDVLLRAKRKIGAGGILLAMIRDVRIFHSLFGAIRQFFSIQDYLVFSTKFAAK